MKRKGKTGLTEKEIAFVEHYCIDKNAAEAARKAGYAEATANKRGYSLLRVKEVVEAIAERMRMLSEQTMTDAKWVRERLRAEAEDMSEGSSASSRVRAIELIGRLNGDFEIDNKQKAGIFDEIPTDQLERIRERLRGIGPTGVAGEPTSGTSSGFTH